MDFHHVLKHIADLINPLLGIWLAAAIFAGRKLAEQPKERRTMLLRVVAAIVVVYIVGHVNRKFHLWPIDPMFPSGHIGFSACIATCLFWLERRSLLITVPVIAAQSILIVYLGFHHWIDVFGALCIAPPLTWLCLAAGQPSQRPNPQ